MQSPESFNDPLDGQINLLMPTRATDFKRFLSDEYIRLVYADPPVQLGTGTIGQSLVLAW